MRLSPTNLHTISCFQGDGKITVAKDDKAIPEENDGGDDDGVNDDDVQSDDEARSEDGELEKPAVPQVIEKIPEEDRRKPHVVKRAFYKIFPCLEKGGQP